MFRNYFKTAWRTLLRNKTFSLINIIGLAIGTLCCLYIVAYVADQYSYDEQHKEVNDIYRITTLWTVQGDKGNWATVTAPVAPAMKKDFAEVQQYTRMVPALGMDHHLLRYKDKSLYVKDAVFADSTLFNVFNFHFDYGNSKNALATPYAIVLMKPLADKLFGDEDPLGKIIQIDNAYGKNNFTVTGVADESLGKSHIHADFFMSMNSGGIGGFLANDNSWAGNNIAISYVKLYPNANVAALEKKLPAFLNKHGGVQLKNLGMTKELHLQPVKTIHTSPGYRGIELITPVSPSFLYLLILIAALIQIIACINFMNLSTAQASKRAKEVGVRKVIGARKNSLILQFLSESFLLTLLSVLIALPLLLFSLPYLNQVTQAAITWPEIFSFNIILLLTGIVILTGLVAGSYPAFYLSAFKVIKVLKGNFTNHVSAAGIRRSLIVFQFVLSIVLITGIIIIYSQLNYIKNKDLGFEKQQKLVFSFYTNDATDKIPSFINDIKQLAEVKTVSRTDNSPGQPVLYDLHLFSSGGNIATAPDASLINADENFIKATGIKLVSGRDFHAFDSGKIIINQALAKTLGIKTDKAEGTKLFSQYGDGTPVTYEIAGVMKDYNYSSLHDEVKPLFLIYSAEGGSEIIVNTNSANYKTLLEKIETIWHKDLPAVPFEYAFVDDEVQKQYAAEFTFSHIVNSFTLMAILISCLGLFGLAAFSAEQRRKEIGVRKVLGASAAGLLQLLSKDFLKLVGIAIIIATPISGWAMSKWLQGFAYRINISWWMFALAGCVAIVIALITVSFQAIKAAIANPVESLRTE